MAFTIAIVNEKGGSAKTATAINFAGELVSAGKRVLVVDLDPQGSAGEYLGLMSTGEDLLDVLLGKLDPRELVYQTTSGIDVIPAGPELGKIADTTLRAREKLLSKALQKLPQDVWDFILLDAPARNDLLTDNILVASDAVLIPVECKNQSITPLVRLLETIKDIQGEFQRPYYVLGIVGTRYITNTNMSRDFVATLKQSFGDQLFETIIRECTKVAEAPAKNQPINVYDSTSNGAQDYHALALEIFARIEAQNMRSVANG